MKDMSVLIEEVKIVDYLMTCYRNGVEPSAEKKSEAFERGINVLELKGYMEEVYAEEIDEYEEEAD